MSPATLAPNLPGRMIPSVRVQRDVGTVKNTFGERTPVWEDVFTTPPPGRLVSSQGGAEQGSDAGEALESARWRVVLRWHPGFPVIKPYPKSRVLMDGQTWRVVDVRDELVRPGERRLMALVVDRLDVV